MIYIVAILLILIFAFLLSSRSMALQRLAVMELIVSVVVFVGYLYACHVSIRSMEEQYMTYALHMVEREDGVVSGLDDTAYADPSQQEELAQWLDTALQEALPSVTTEDGRYYENLGVYTESTNGYDRVFFMGEDESFDEEEKYQKAVYPLMNQVIRRHSSGQVVVDHTYGVMVWADPQASIGKNILCVQIPLTGLVGNEEAVRGWFIRTGWILWGAATLVVVLVVVLQNREWQKMIRAMAVISSGKEEWKKPRIYSNEMQTMWNSLSELVKNAARSNYEKYRILRAYYRFAPKQVERILGRDSMAEVSTGDYANVQGIVVQALTTGNGNSSRLQYIQSLNRRYEILTKNQQEQDGILISGSSDLSSLEVLFLDEAGRAVAFGVNAAHELETEQTGAQMLMIAHRGEYLYGVAGDEEQAMPFIVSDEWKVLNTYQDRLLQAGIRMVVTDTVIGDIAADVTRRYLGYVGDARETFKLYEILDACPEQERRRKQRADERFQQGLRLFYKDDFYLARNAFSDALKECPEDKVIKWYLFTCEHHLNHPEVEQISYGLFREELENGDIG